MSVAEWETAYNQLKALIGVIPSTSTDTNVSAVRTAVQSALTAARTGLVAALNAESTPS